MGISVLARQPAFVNIEDFALVDAAPTNPGVALTYWGNQYVWKPTRNPFQGWFTGVHGNRNQQLSNWPWMPGSTGVQLVRDEIGIMLQSWSLKKDLPYRRRLGTIVLGANFPRVYPFRSPNGTVQVSFELKVPSAYVTRKGVSQVVAYLNFTDHKNKRGLWYGLTVFDTRGPRGDMVMWDNGTNTPIVSVSAGVPSALQYGTTRSLESTPYSDYRLFRSTVRAENLLAAVEQLNRKFNGFYSTDCRDYSLRHANMNPELYVPEGSYAHLGMGLRNWEVSYAN